MFGSLATFLKSRDAEREESQKRARSQGFKKRVNQLKLEKELLKQLRADSGTKFDSYGFDFLRDMDKMMKVRKSMEAADATKDIEVQKKREERAKKKKESEEKKKQEEEKKSQDMKGDEQPRQQQQQQQQQQRKRNRKRKTTSDKTEQVSVDVPSPPRKKNKSATEGATVPTTKETRSGRQVKAKVIFDPTSVKEK